MVCLCLPSINLIFERATSRKTSHNRPRTIYPCFSNSRKKNSVGLSERTTVFLQEGGSTASRGLEMTAAPVLDFDAELAMFTEEPRAGGVAEPPPSINGTAPDGLVCEAAGDCERISCVRITSADGRKEGWLTSNDDDPGASETQHVTAAARRTGQPNMEQFRKEAQRILVPGRIWDGRGRIAGEEIT